MTDQRGPRGALLVRVVTFGRLESLPIRDHESAGAQSRQPSTTRRNKRPFVELSPQLWIWGTSLSVSRPSKFLVDAEIALAHGMLDLGLTR